MRVYVIRRKNIFVCIIIFGLKGLWIIKNIVNLIKSIRFEFFVGLYNNYEVFLFIYYDWYYYKMIKERNII